MSASTDTVTRPGAVVRPAGFTAADVAFLLRAFWQYAGTALRRKR